MPGAFDVALPPTLAAIAALVGPVAAYRLAEAKGGKKRLVPLEVKPAGLTNLQRMKLVSKTVEEEISPSLQADGGNGTDLDLDVILDVPVTLSLEVGRARLPIRNLLQLNQGSVIELDRLAGEPLDVLVNGTLIAHGEVVVVNEKFGIRLTDVISPSERIKKLR